jgi:hypothetical protein
MLPLPKNYFQWREPEEFRRIALATENAKARWWHKSLFSFAVACALVSTSGLGFLNPKNQPLPLGGAFVLAFSLSLMVSYFAPRLERLSPSIVKLFDKHLVRTSGGILALEFKTVASVALQDCGPYRVLAVELRRGGQLIFGVPPEVEAQALEDFFTRRGITWLPSNSAAHLSGGKDGVPTMIAPGPRE